MIAINETPGDSQLEDVGTEADDPATEIESLQDSTVAEAPHATQAAAATATVMTANRSANIGHNRTDGNT